MNARHTIIAAALLVAAQSADAATCKQMLGNWDINYSINGNLYTDEYQITAVKGVNLTAFNRKTGVPVAAWCRAGVVMIDDGDSDYVVQHYYVWPTGVRILNVFANDGSIDAPLLISVPLAGLPSRPSSAKSSQSVGMPQFDKLSSLKAEVQK
jgi:hypothetical protein